jgi:hypothetical protein
MCSAQKKTWVLLGVHRPSLAGALIAALITLHREAQRFRRPGVNVARIVMKLVEPVECFDIGG